MAEEQVCPVCWQGLDELSQANFVEHVESCLLQQEAAERDEQIEKDAAVAAQLQEEAAKEEEKAREDRLSLLPRFNTQRRPVLPSSVQLSSSSSPPLDPSSFLLSDGEQLKLRELLPPRFQTYHFEPLYSSMRHGFSLNTLYSRSEGHSPFILLVQDDAHFLFGGFVNEPLRCRKSNKAFCGTGESFLFKLQPDYCSYSWSTQNAYYMLMASDGLALGCGDTGYGLWLDGDLEQGSSSPCETFLNDMLAHQEFFKCLRVEVWTLRA
ncbi:Oxidation resistance protein 1 [Balamuthia mandrillaris]